MHCSPQNFPGQNTGVGCHFLLQGIFPTQESNWGLLHCWQILYQLSYKNKILHKKITILADTDNCLSVAICLGFCNIRFRPLKIKHMACQWDILETVYATTYYYLLTEETTLSSLALPSFPLDGMWTKMTDISTCILYHNMTLAMEAIDCGASNRTEEYISDTSGSLIYEIHYIQS